MASFDGGGEFAELVLDWFDRCGRKDLPWQTDKSPYRVWLSETMLQQTQVATVIPYFNAFVARFPTVEALAQASLDDVLGHWSGLGYYARARNLHKAARQIQSLGCFPDSLEGLLQLPGVGLSTAGAIMSIAYGQSQPILDGNVRRVLARYHALSGWPSAPEVNKRLWQLSRDLTSKRRAADYTQAIMDLGATVCTRARPLCGMCPLNCACIAFREQRTGEFPTPKPSRQMPIKQQTFLLLANDRRQVWLEKRPPVGIWGGLWCLPAFDNAEQALAWCREHKVEIADRYALAARRHTFSHFHLDYTPLVVLTKVMADAIGEPSAAEWRALASIESLGLATPIKQLLKQFKAREDNDDKTG